MIAINLTALGIVFEQHFNQLASAGAVDCTVTERSRSPFRATLKSASIHAGFSRRNPDFLKAPAQQGEDPMPDQTPPAWLTAGLQDLGFHETGDNQGIESFIAQARCGSVGDPWCAIWTNAKLEQSGVKGTRSASSQSFRHDSNFVQLNGPALGAIAVYWRGSPDSGLGHVGFYMGETATQILTLGGNESDAVRKQFEPRARLRGYWWPKSLPLPQGGVIGVTSEAGNPAGKVT